MAKSIILILAVIISTFLLFDSALGGHRCRRNSRRCCRRKIDYGRCHGHVRRWAYNVSCGQCVPFDYSGCNGYDEDNVFDYKDECYDCCKETRPCPKYRLSTPHRGCEYKWNDGPDGCPRPRLDCHQCRETSYCRPDSCRSGQRCIPERHHRPCNRCPCPQYRCVTDPCYATVKYRRPCEKCVALPSPKCDQEPCPLIAHREDHCAPAVRQHHHCPITVECPPEGNPCQRRRCYSKPKAKCITDPCDCRKHWWSDYDGRTFYDDECY